MTLQKQPVDSLTCFALFNATTKGDNITFYIMIEDPMLFSLYVQYI